MTSSTTHLERHTEESNFSLTPDRAQKEILHKHDTEYFWIIGGLKNWDPIMGSLAFHGWLQQQYPELLDFPDDGDRYQTVTCWVLPWGRGEMN